MASQHAPEETAAGESTAAGGSAGSAINVQNPPTDNDNPMAINNLLKAQLIALYKQQFSQIKDLRLQIEDQRL
jgi:hypothetical protein